MKCTEFEQELQLCVEQRQGLSAAMTEHVADCGTCAAVWREQLFLDRVIEDWIRDIPIAAIDRAALERDAVPSADGGTSHTLRFREVGERHASERRLVLTLVVAACSVLLMLAALRSPVQVDPASGGNLAWVSKNARELPSEYASLDGLLRDAGDAYLGLAEQALLPVREIVPASPETDVALSDVQGPAPEDRMSEWQAGIVPIQRDVEQAVGFLLNVVRPAAELPL